MSPGTNFASISASVRNLYAVQCTVRICYATLNCGVIDKRIQASVNICFAAGVALRLKLPDKCFVTLCQLLIMTRCEKLREGIVHHTVPVHVERRCGSSLYADQLLWVY